MKLAALHHVEQTLHRLGLQKAAAADEEIVFGEKPDEIEPELPGRGLHAEADVGHAARHVSGHGGMGEFHLLRAVDFGLVDPVQGQQLVEQQARAGIMIGD